MISLLRKSLLISSAVLTIVILFSQLHASPLWGELEPGPYRVGYKTVLTHDLSRPAITVDADGRKINSLHPGRQMQIGVWYPATKSTRSRSMLFEEYVYLLKQELEFAPLSANQRSQAVALFVKEPLSRGSSEERLQRLMKTTTRAIKNAPPTRMRFPLIVYAHIAPSANNIMCEYLASHGYVVATIPWKGTFEYNLDVGLTGVETQIKDIEFAIGLLRKEPNIAADKIAVIGMSFGAISVLGLQTRNSDIDAVISLDGGIGSSFGAAVVQRTPYYSLWRITKPLLHLYGLDVPGTDLSYLDTLKYSRRYLIAFPGMRHADFTNQGMLEHFVPGTKDKPEGDSKTGFEWVCRYVNYFLDAYLKLDPRGIRFMENRPEDNRVPRGTLTIDRRQSLEAPPSVQQLQSMIEGQGIKSVIALYVARKKTDPQPFPQQTLSDVGRWLGGRNDWESAGRIADLRLESYANSAWANFAAAEVYRRLGRNERARQLYEEALRLLPSDFDPEIDFNRRRAIYEGARRNIELLSDKF
ncbi:MAG TPA: acyl-CoA thioester hydrolase/BAAT C-terminal domain-containing protein [Pyrinomonadaceae bacterium]